ncbi:hypothetical protein [Pseudooceanicola marinus]|uniref:hypothetical protein n=1 Tax=Pseudooceanicola marinus TaxID=396013 RepID=UPI001CD5D61D|nr:hypothetical protein [Pseudooceanicola marinus]MCA1338291.1 hypothetical protein [Pseudooceanicola marinus]
MSIDLIIATLPSKIAAERQQMRDNAERLIEKGSAAKQADARKLLNALDELEAEERETLAQWVRDTPIGDRVLRAFEVVPLSDTEAKVIRALMDNPGSTSAELSKACGWRGQTWHAHFGKMCGAREVYLWPAEMSARREEKLWSGILADFDENTATWTMKPEVADAFATMNLGPGRSTP